LDARGTLSLRQDRHVYVANAEAACRSIVGHRSPCVNPVDVVTFLIKTVPK
jgi:hypothetical protein